jgi:hypothetical protein
MKPVFYMLFVLAIAMVVGCGPRSSDVERIGVSNPAQSTENVQVLGLAEATGGADASATFTVAPDNLGDVQIEVGQISLFFDWKIHRVL